MGVLIDTLEEQIRQASEDANLDGHPDGGILRQEWESALNRVYRPKYPTSAPTEHHYIVTVSDVDRAKADQIIAERIDYDEEYEFLDEDEGYTISRRPWD